MPPIYEYQCCVCGEKEEVFLHKIRPRIKIMCKCGKQMTRMISRVNTEKDNVRLSYAMGISPHQLPEAMRLWPDSKYVPDRTGGTLLLEVRNRKDKLKKMKERNLEEY